MQQDSGPPAAEIARVIADVLSGPDFRRESSGPGRILADWMASWTLWDDIREFWSLLAESVPAAGTRTLAAAAVAVMAIWGLRRVFGLRRARRGARAADAGGNGARPPRTAEEWAAVAAARAAAGRYRQAATALYLGRLLRLDQAGALAFHASKTPGEYAREVSANPAGVRARRFLHAFQELSFGRRRPTLGAYRDLEALARDPGDGE